MPSGPELLTDGNFSLNPYDNGWYFVLNPYPTWENGKILINAEEDAVGYDVAATTIGLNYRLEFDLVQYQAITDYSINVAYSAGDPPGGGEGSALAPDGGSVTFIGTFNVTGIEHIVQDFTATANDVQEGNYSLYLGVNTLGGVYIDNVSFRQFTDDDLFLQTVHLVASDLSGDIQQLNAGKDDDSVPIYYELETQELEFGNRIMNKRISDKLVVFSENADDSKIEMIADENDPKPINIELGKRVNNTTLPAVDAHFLTMRWSGNSVKKSPILEGFYFNKVEDKGVI